MTPAEDVDLTHCDRRDGVRRVLLVEDNMIIAMDTEEVLREIGVAHVDTVGSVAEARLRLGGEAYDLALLDYDLGDETSLPLACELVAAGIPLAFATGYGEGTAAIDELPHLGLLKKPYTREDIVALLDRLRA